jgi:hypothetical protein
MKTAKPSNNTSATSTFGRIENRQRLRSVIARLEISSHAVVDAARPTRPFWEPATILTFHWTTLVLSHSTPGVYICLIIPEVVYNGISLLSR